ncbi:putative bifunctional diguanylate cyclase/phosphodiesterase [Alteromonas sp. CYL-A6]|uniref:putative bifunctional diguanylate cyclase/phosphodiesterase n=1 Tax=Alteromonas nitratireducens TaxID=3390813 RepID=UPI0034AECD22
MKRISVFSPSASATVQRELVDVLYGNSFAGLLITIIAFSGLVFGFHSEGSQSIKFAFWAMMILVMLVRLGDTLHWLNALRGTDYSPIAARNRFMLGSVAAGIIWSTYAVLLYDIMTEIELASTMVVLSAMSGGAASVLAPSRFVSFTYCTLLILPVSLRALLDNEPHFSTLGALGVIFWVGMLTTANRTNRFFVNTAQIKAQNETLKQRMLEEQNEIERMNKALSVSNERLDDANARLEREVAKRTNDIHRLSNRDPLTELLNRNGFVRYLETLIEKAKDLRNQVAVLFIDLDGFKQVNDSLGHQIGDAVLREVSSRLQRYCEPDHLARWGGDEFVIALPYANVDTAKAVAQAARSGITIPITVGDNQVTLDATIGIALFPEHGMNATSLIQEADLTMYEQKKRQRGSIGVFSEEIFLALREEQLLCENLRQAISQGEMFLVYQPILNARTKRLYAVEALLRWQKDDQLIPPDVFIPLAERTGQMQDIGTWVLHRACIDVAQWPLPDDISVSVNVSVIQLLDDNFVRVLDKVLVGSGLAAHRLHLEITESVFTHNKDKVIAQINAIKARGISVSIDDFGTGYSSLSQLQSLRCDYIKIDRSFVQNPEEGSDTIIRATLLIAREFSCNTIAEGIETDEQAARLTLMGVDHLQGYLYSRPLTSEALISWYNDNN